MKLDLHLWASFLENFNGKSFFLHPVTVTSADIHFYSDASKLGAEAFYGKRWFQVVFPRSWDELSITFRELYPIMVALAMYGHFMANHRVLFHTDNKGAMFIINKQSSKGRAIMSLVRKMVLDALTFNIRFSSAFIEGATTVLADRISRFQASRELLAQCGMRPVPDQVPLNLQPCNWQLP